MCPRFRVLINITARAFGHTPMGFMEPFEAMDFLLVNSLWWILITFKAIHGQLLNIYAIYLLTFDSSLYYLRSSGSILLSMPAVRSKTLGDRAFMVAAPRLWNSLPKELRAITNVNSFKAHIKTYLFRTLYWWAILYSVLTCIHMYSFYCYFYFFFLNALSFICFL